MTAGGRADGGPGRGWLHGVAQLDSLTAEMKERQSEEP
jgi:hypothetical protein